LPQIKFCTDNAAMIAMEGLNMYLSGNFASMDINAKAAIPLEK
jgi:tRNA A37 threonylcarbamoyltransferase TsaD